MKVQDFDKFWVDKHRYDFAEKQYHEFFAMDAETTIYSPLVSEIAKAREHLQNSLEKHAISLTLMIFVWCYVCLYGSITLKTLD
ncbi:probable elongation factor 1-delta isoform X2 [Drosophila willistoni]|uniref:probable elongation factor 1-delta isoform X2 n=1 Tax=Drosophila willistoni TaxID=7260 RepID=UPI001F078A17|nr:probable elongation factor 1-delta isoform X2 [Drosophila willistoni]